MNYYSTLPQVVNDLKILVQVTKLKKKHPEWGHPILSDERLDHLEDALNKLEKEIELTT